MVQVLRAGAGDSLAEEGLGGRGDGGVVGCGAPLDREVEPWGWVSWWWDCGVGGRKEGRGLGEGTYKRGLGFRLGRARFRRWRRRGW